jgi:tellurite resistance protein
MTVVIVSLVLVVVLTAVISLVILYGQFRRWPPTLWKQRLLDRFADLSARRRTLAGPDPTDLQAHADRLATDLFHRHLQTINVHRLDEYPGIGPGTVERVYAAGGRTLDDLTHFRFESIHGIGPSKAADLRAAVATLVREARSRFDAGGCPEAQEFRRKLAVVNAEAGERSAARKRELAGVEAALRSFDGLLAAANEVTFWNYLFHRGTAGPSDDVMNRPFPAVTLPPRPVPVARPAARPVPPPVPIARPAVARPTPAPVTLPPTPAASTPPPAPATDLFKAELHAPVATAIPSSGDHPWLPKLVAYTRFAFAVAKADGRMAQAEKKVIRAFLAEQFGHDPVLNRHIDPLMERTEARVPAEAEALAGIETVTTPAERVDLYKLAERVADASGERNPRERDLLARLATALGVTSPSAPGVSPVPPGRRGELPVVHASDPRAVLEIDAETEVTADLVRRRYALLSDKLCPTKAAALGPEFAHMAAEKRDRLRTAAETLLAPFGEPLEKPAPPPPADLRHNPDLDAVFDM